MLVWNHSFIHLSACARWFPYIFGDEGENERGADSKRGTTVQVRPFDPAQEKWEYYIQRFETELALYNLLSGDATAEARKNLLLSKVGPEAFRILVDHHRPEAVTT